MSEYGIKVSVQGKDVSSINEDDFVLKSSREALKDIKQYYDSYSETTDKWEYHYYTYDFFPCFLNFVSEDGTTFYPGQNNAPVFAGPNRPTASCYVSKTQSSIYMSATSYPKTMYSKLFIFGNRGAL